MEELVQDLVDGLFGLVDLYEEVHDPRIQERFTQILEEGFVDNNDGSPFEVPQELGMFTLEGNIALQEILQGFLDQACDVAYAAGHDDPLDRRESMRNEDLAEFLGEDWWE